MTEPSEAKESVPLVCEKSPSGRHCWHSELGSWSNNQKEVCCWCGEKVQTHGSFRPTSYTLGTVFTESMEVPSSLEKEVVEKMEKAMGKHVKHRTNNE